MNKLSTNTSNLISAIKQNVELALKEDIGKQDLSAMLVNATSKSLAVIISKERGVLCGTQWLNKTFKILDPKIKIKWFLEDGDVFNANQKLCEINGSTRAILSGERVALNFLQTLSATSTETRKFVDLIKDKKSLIFDTRKTIPSLRVAQKYAVLIGGGNNQRFGLYDKILIKENHIKLNHNFKDLLSKSLRITKINNIQIEVENLIELKNALSVGFKNILLDNFSVTNLKKAVVITGRKAVLEASGNITLKNVKKIATTGVSRISVGSLTKSIRAIDLSLRIIQHNLIL
jgi:nicotinate-nucleotide pyrophosphorylase (carboxylating)